MDRRWQAGRQFLHLSRELASQYLFDRYEAKPDDFRAFAQYAAQGGLYTSEAYLQHITDMTAAGLPVDPDWVVQGQFTYRSGLAAAELLLSPDERPTAIFASNDDMAAAALAVAHGLQIAVPEALTVVGFDDTPIASTVWPELTTIHQPISAMGRAAVSLIVDEIKAERAGNAPGPTHQLMKFTLVKRGSSGPPPAKAPPRRRPAKA